MALKLYDTLSREIRPLSACDGKQFRFYLCGPTVYGPTHIGNFRTMILGDILFRMLQLDDMYPYYVRNLTDVDDRTIARCQESRIGLEGVHEEMDSGFSRRLREIEYTSAHS